MPQHQSWLTQLIPPGVATKIPTCHAQKSVLGPLIAFLPSQLVSGTSWSAAKFPQPCRRIFRGILPMRVSTKKDGTIHRGKQSPELLALMRKHFIGMIVFLIGSIRPNDRGRREHQLEGSRRGSKDCNQAFWVLPRIDFSGPSSIRLELR